MTKKGGRPRKINDDILKKLEQGFMYGFTDVEACLYADISPQTLYNYCKRKPKFLERKEELKNRPKLRAKMNIVKSLESNDLKTSKWYLERKSRDEFGIKDQEEQRLMIEMMKAQLNTLSGPKEGEASKDWKQAVINAANKRAVDNDE